MCVVTTFSMVKTRRDHRNSTKDLGNWRKKNKKRVGRGKKQREILEVRRRGVPAEGGPAEGGSGRRGGPVEGGPAEGGEQWMKNERKVKKEGRNDNREGATSLRRLKIDFPHTKIWSRNGEAKKKRETRTEKMEKKRKTNKTNTRQKLGTTGQQGPTDEE